MTSFPPPSTSDRDTPARRAEQAHTTCLRLLTARARSRSELAGALARRGVDDDVAEAVLARLTDAGLVDDVDFARQWVRSRRAATGRGRTVLAAELRTKGVDAETVETVLDEVDPAGWRERAEELVAAKLCRADLGGDADGHTDGDTRVVRRLVAMLVRRGHAPGMAYDVVTSELGRERERRRA